MEKKNKYRYRYRKFESDDKKKKKESDVTLHSLFLWEVFVFYLKKYLTVRGKPNKKLFYAYIKAIKLEFGDYKNFAFALFYSAPKYYYKVFKKGLVKETYFRYMKLRKVMQHVMKIFVLNIKGKGKTRGIDTNNINCLKMLGEVNAFRLEELKKMKKISNNVILPEVEGFVNEDLSLDEDEEEIEDIEHYKWYMHTKGNSSVENFKKLLENV